MPHSRRTDIHNRLLKALAVDDFETLAPHLEEVELPTESELIGPNDPVRRLVFLESGIASLTTAGSQDRVEVGLIGREGLVGASPVLLHADRVPYRHFMQVAGRGYAITPAALTATTETRPTLRRLLLRYVQAEIVQIRQTAYANVTASLEMRLARWLLMYLDRVDGNELPVKHEFLAIMLGVHRPGVTLAVQALEGAGHIRARRMRIEVVDRAGLERVAGEGYGPAEAEYVRLIETPEQPVSSLIPAK